MSFVFAAPEALAAAAADMAGIGSTLNAANVVAAVPTTGVLAAAADEVSTQVAALLSAHAQGYQQLSRQMMTAFHDQFVQALRASADAYATAEASAAQTMVNAVNAPARALLGHPLISADASTGGGSNALSRVQSMFLGTGGSSALGGSAAANAAASGALQLQPTGGASGLSAVGALLPPTKIASAMARRRCRSRRAASLEIHWLEPSAAALRPSMLVAYFQVTCGRPVRCLWSHSRSGPAAPVQPTPRTAPVGPLLTAGPRHPQRSRSGRRRRRPPSPPWLRSERSRMAESCRSGYRVPW